MERRQWNHETRREAAWIYLRANDQTRKAILGRYLLTWGELITASERHHT